MNHLPQALLFTNQGQQGLLTPWERPPSLGTLGKPACSVYIAPQPHPQPFVLTPGKSRKPATQLSPGSLCPGMERGRPRGPRAAQPPPMGTGGCTPASCPEGGMTRRGLFCPVAHRSNRPANTPFAGCLPCPVSLPSFPCFLGSLFPRLGFQSLPGICLGKNTM